jgi:hypothetical protein
MRRHEGRAPATASAKYCAVTRVTSAGSAAAVLVGLATPVLLLVTPPFLGRVAASDRVLRVRYRR